MKLSGNTILITGGSSGIGLALAKKFISLKNKVVITGRDEHKLEEIKYCTPDIEFFHGDLSNTDTIAALVEYVRVTHDAINVLINNAAVQYNYCFRDDASALQKIDYEIAINLQAPIKLTASLLPTLLKKSESAIVNVSSGLFMAPKKTASVYCATKAAIHSFSKTLRYQLETSNTRVFEIIPPLVNTPMTAGRGKSKMTAEDLVDEFLRDFRNNRYESFIGKSKILKVIQRISPAVADALMKNGL